MQKSLMAVIGSLVALAIVLVVIGSTRQRRAEAANHSPVAAHATLKTVKSQPANATKAAPQDASDDSADDSADGDSPKAIRLVRDPLPAPPFLLNDLDGNLISTAAYHGKVVLINFWATWCPPCREEIPEMIALANKYKDKLQIIGVSMDDDPPEEVRAFARAQKMNYPIVMGSDKLSEEYGGVDALPTTFVLDTNGRVVQKHMGLYPDGSLRPRNPRAARHARRRAGGNIRGHGPDLPEERGARDVASRRRFFRPVARPEQNRAQAPQLRMCTCGCKMTVAQCRMTDPDCATSKALAAKIVREVKAAANPLGPSAQNR